MRFATRAKVAGLVGLAGASVMIAALLRDGSVMRGEEAGLVASAFAGAATGGAVFAGWFGRAGGPGWLIAGLGAGLCTALGGAVGAAVQMLASGSPDVAAAFVMGPAFVVSLILGAWPVTLVWAVAFTAIHLGAGGLRGGRDAHANASARGRGFTR
jgi:hypothetical protein